MPIRYGPNCAVFEGPAIVDEASELAGWLIDAQGRLVDLSACTAMHASVLQCLIALGPAILAPPRDAELARWLAPLLAFPPAASETAPEPAPKPARRRRRKAPAPRRTAKREAAIA